VRTSKTEGERTFASKWGNNQLLWMGKDIVDSGGSGQKLFLASALGPNELWGLDWTVYTHIVMLTLCNGIIGPINLSSTSPQPPCAPWPNGFVVHNSFPHCIIYADRGHLYGTFLGGFLPKITINSYLHFFLNLFITISLSVRIFSSFFNIRPISSDAL
jgi:hypothetical protein